jgi:hypothetical protein
MKKMILLMTVCSACSFAASAQSNRTYKTDMSTERIYQEERRGGRALNEQPVRLNTGSHNQETMGVDNARFRMNNVGTFQGYRSNPNGMLNSSQQGDNRFDMGNNGLILDPNDSRYPQYDTSKNNGHCLGCGSGTLTDPHPTMR